MRTTESYIPALGFHWLTRFYDPLIHRFMREEFIRSQLALEADILPGMRVLDLGCGTGSLAILIKEGHLLAQVYGLDADVQVLEIARNKADQRGTDIALEQGLAYQLPFPDEWFDRVITSLMFHHLTTQQKQQALKEVSRVLRPGGKFILLDIGVPSGGYAWIVSQVMARLERAGDNIRGLLPKMVKDAGLVNVVEKEPIWTMLGSLSLLRAEKQKPIAV